MRVRETSRLSKTPDPPEGGVGQDDSPREAPVLTPGACKGI